MSDASRRVRSHVTLALCTILHAFTHAYSTLLIPLYLLMAKDLKLHNVGSASAVVTVYGLVYCLGSYPAGVMADRFDRKAMLGIGLLGNAVAILSMGLTRQYELIMLSGVLAGLFGTLFHPAANTLVPAHYPRHPGMAIGVLGAGSGIGFFAGPQFAGWRAQVSGNWQTPLVEAGIVGLVFGIVFLFVAREARATIDGKSRPLGPVLRWRMTWLALVLVCRDFAGLATISLSSVYLQKAHHLDARQTGFILGAMMLMSVLVSPIAVYLSPGRRRLPALAGVLICGGAVLATVPFWNVGMVLPVLMTFMTFQLGSYAISDAAMLERIEPDMRGRVVGIFLMIAGTISSMAPFVMVRWTDHLGAGALEPSSYVPLYATLGALMLAAVGSTPLIARLGPVAGPPIEPITQTMPQTVEVGL